MKIVYFVHDLSDSAVRRRMRMLVAGGATVTPIGFRRGPDAIDEIDGIEAIDLGQTDDRKLARRTLSVVKTLANLQGLAAAMQGADTILARNLEMLVIAARARKRYAPGARLVYECLDIHRLLLSSRMPDLLLRRLESSLWRETDLLLTSSPAFIENYFGPRKFPSPIKLVENKVFFENDVHMPDMPLRIPAGPPWRIGWFGMLRCRKSLEILSALSVEADGAVEVVLRGRPSPAIFPDLRAEIAHLPHMHFEGPYQNPADLPHIYSDVHLTWAIDYYEQGQNSAWLLPNRLYEATLFGSVPIALAGVETSRWLAQHDVGIVLPEPLERELVDFFRGFDQDSFAVLSEKVRELPRRDLAVGLLECRELVTALSSV